MASKNEKRAAELGISLKEYKRSDEYKNKKSAEKDSENRSNEYQDMIDAILSNTPAQQEVLPDFEETYSDDLEQEDLAQSEALYTPHFEQLIANELEDLNAWSEIEGVNYDRSLRRARVSLASGGGAIGSEREQEEEEISSDYETNKKNRVRATERTVGTEKIKEGGYQSSGQTQEGSLVGRLKEAVQEGQLWYKNQRAQRYYGNANTYYSSPTGYNLE